MSNHRAVARTSSSTSSKRRAQRRFTATLVWRFATLKVSVRHDVIDSGSSLVEVTLVTPKGAPLPITATGYVAQFLSERDLAAAGGAVAFVTAWLDREAKTKAWHAAEFRWRQLDLFAVVPNKARRR